MAEKSPTAKFQPPQGILRNPPTTQPLDTSPDRRADPQFVEHSIKDISDADLFAALDLDRPDLKEVLIAVQRRDYPAACRAWVEHWKSVAPDRRLYSGASGMLMPLAEATASQEPRRAEILKIADEIVAHKITGWGTVTIQHGPVVNFDADYGESGKYGFHYWGWSENLIWAWYLTHDPKYLASFDELFNQWYAQRNHIHGQITGLDVVYYELGLGVRCIPFLEYYLTDFPDRSPDTDARMLKSILGAARWLYEEEKRQYRRGNWQMIGSFGLAYIGAMLPEFREAQKWVRMGSERILQHTHDDFFADGCHSERSPASYMIIAYREPRNLAVLLQKLPEYAELRQRMRPLLENCLNFFLRILPPDGILPGINDGSRAYMPAALMQDGVNLFNRQDMLWIQHALLGVKLPENAGTPPDGTSICFPDSGFTVMRSDWTPNARFVLINHGPTGGGHSHNDSLDFSLHAFGQACAIDSGIGYTYDDPNQNTWYRRTRAHNMIMIDDDDIDRAQAQGREVAWTSLPTLDYFAATHYGYLQSKGVTHRRHFVFVRPNYWLIYDVIEARDDAGQHRVSWNLHSPTPMDAHQNGFASTKGSGLIVLPASDWTSQKQNGVASVRGIRGYPAGTDYAQIDWLSFAFTLKPDVPSTLGVLLFPFAADLPQVKVTLVKQDHRAAHFSIEHPDGTDHILLGEEGAMLQSGSFIFTGACAVVHIRNGKPTNWSAAKTLTLRLGNNLVVDSDVPADQQGNA